MANDDEEITLKMVMEHLGKMKYDLEQKVEKEVGSLACELREFRQEFRDFSKGVDDLDDRVQDIESEQLPKRMKRVEVQVGITA